MRCGGGTKTNSVDGIMFKILRKPTPSINSKITVLYVKPFKSTQARLLNTDTEVVEREKYGRQGYNETDYLYGIQVEIPISE